MQFEYTRICLYIIIVIIIAVLTNPVLLQDDKDLVHEFVMAEGLTCLIKVGAEADQNYQNYILRGTVSLTVQEGTLTFIQNIFIEVPF